MGGGYSQEYERKLVVSQGVRTKVRWLSDLTDFRP